MISGSLNNMLNYFNENKKYLEGYKTEDLMIFKAGIHDHLFKEVKYDAFEKTEEMKVLRSENYSKNKVKINKFEMDTVGAFNNELQGKIRNCLSDYYAGDKTVEEVKDFFQESCMAMRVYYTGQLKTSGNNEADNQKIVSKIFEIFSKENQRAALKANKEEGIEINKEYGGNPQGEINRGYAYYNSFHYYECESMRDVFRESALEVSAEWELPEIDLAEVEKHTIYTLDGALDFNSGWNYQYRNNMRVGSIIDQDKVPPKDFKLFFNDTAGSSLFAGILRIETGNIRIEREVPFEYKGNDIFNVSELVNIKLDDKEEQSKINDFIKNFEIFTVTQGAGSRISWVSGNYQSKFI